MTQYYSRTDIPYAGDSNFTIPFSYIDKTDIHVYINDTLISTWVWLNDSQINITSTLSTGDVVSIRRITPIDEKIVTYQNMSMVLNDDNLNLSQDQVLNAVQEVYDNNVSFQIDVNAQIDEIDTKVDTANVTANQALSNSETAISIANEALSNSEDAVATANAAETKADNAVSTANTASSNASQAVSTANEANTNAQAAVNTANSAADDASEALSKANTAISTANTAKDTADTAKDTADEALADSATALANSETAINTANDAADDATEAVATANTANTNASNAVSTANSASSAANSAVSTANSASTAANNAVSTANTASTNASTAIAKAEEAIEIAQTAVSQGLTPATATSLGGIKVGDNLSITADGTLSADAQSIEVDDDLSTISENPVQNKVITGALNGKQDTLTAGTDLEIVEGSTLPAGYVQLKSITSTTTQYINTKISMTTNYKAVIVGRLTQQPSSNFTTILGADNQNNNASTQGKYNVILGWGNAANGFYTENCIPSGAIVDYTYSSYPWDTETHTFTVTVTPTRTMLNIDGTIDAISLLPAAWDTPTPLYLFTRNTAANGGIGSITPFELEKIEQYQDGVLVFNGIPCKLGDIVGLYNTVTNEFLPNSGTGAFIEGDIIPNETIINFTNETGYITGIDSNDVTTALGYTPYNASNPNGYTSNVGTVTSVNGVSPTNGNVAITIPTVNNGTLTITQDGNTLGTFGANQSGNTNIDLAGENNFLNHKQITNCILETPSNWMTYSGSQVTIKAGTKYLLPNGRNADGTLNNAEVTLQSDVVFTNTGQYDGTICVVGLADGNIWSWGSVTTMGYYRNSSEFPIPATGFYWLAFSEEDNSWYTTVNGAAYTQSNVCPLGTAKITSDSSILSINPFKPVHLLTIGNREEISGWGMPSYTYIDLTLGASGATYLSPANGWYTICSNSNGTYPKNIELINSSGGDVNTSTKAYNNNNSGWLRCSLPVKKGDIVACYYNNISLQHFRFVYAQGSGSEVL